MEYDVLHCIATGLSNKKRKYQMKMNANVSAYLLINFQKDHKEELMESLKQIKELTEINEIFGEFGRIRL